MLEHVESDVKFLRSVAAAAPPVARFVVTVPAFSFLWSGHDIYLGHYGRYTLREIADVAQKAGLSVERQCCFFGAIFPAVAALRMSRRLLLGVDRSPSSDMRHISEVLNRLLRAVCRLEEAAFMQNRAFGLTAFLLATRAGDSQ